MRLMGELVSRTALHQKASIEEATNAIKQDILRSMASRLELHWDSVIEEENGSPEGKENSVVLNIFNSHVFIIAITYYYNFHSENITLHEPPRRVHVELPQNKITLSDYLFPGEGPHESLVLLKEVLDLEVQESQVQKDVERQVGEYCFSSHVHITYLCVSTRAVNYPDI